MNATNSPDPSPFIRDEAEPVFDEPWQAQVLGLAFVLVEKGIIPHALWSETLGCELRRAESAGKPDDHHTYYDAVLAAVEKLGASHAGMALGALDRRTEEWRRAYLNTPHGHPVKLEAGLKPPVMNS